MRGLANLFQRGAFEEALSVLDRLQETTDKQRGAEFRRIRGWAELSLGNTEQAYNLFWSCADHAGSRVGILVLTILAGQVKVAIDHWMRHCQTLDSVPLELPDSLWHSRPVALAAINVLKQYPFPPRSPSQGSAALYMALLHRSLADPPNAFLVLSEVAAFYPLADLVRERWLEEVVCLPAPKVRLELDSKTLDKPFSPPEPELGTGALEAVECAVKILLYPDVATLEKQSQKALAETRWLDALEILRRLLYLVPDHTSSLEKRWRLYLQLENLDAAKMDIFALVDIYEKNQSILKCLEVARTMVELFPNDERALLKMCFIQARLGYPIALATYGRRLLDLCLSKGLSDRFSTYRRWLLRQKLTLDDRNDLNAQSS